MAGIEVMEGSRKHARREKQPAYEFLVKRRKFIGLFKEAQICFLRTWGYVSRQTTLVSLVVLRRYARYDRLCVLSRSSMCAIVLSRVIRRPCEWVTLKCHQCLTFFGLNCITMSKQRCSLAELSNIWTLYEQTVTIKPKKREKQKHSTRCNFPRSLEVLMAHNHFIAHILPNLPLQRPQLNARKIVQAYLQQYSTTLKV